MEMNEILKNEFGLDCSSLKREDVEKIVEQYDNDFSSRIHLFEVDEPQDWMVKEYDGETIDFSKLTINEMSEEDIQSGKPVATFMITGGLNGSGKLEDYLEDIKKLVEDFSKKLNLNAEIQTLDTDIPDDVWTALILLYCKKEGE